MRAQSFLLLAASPGMAGMQLLRCSAHELDRSDDLKRRFEMGDLLMIAFALLMFLLMFGYIRGCDHLR
jgi:hypothetical protein